MSDLSDGSDPGFDTTLLPDIQDPFPIGTDWSQLPTIPGSTDPGGAFSGNGSTPSLSDTGGLNTSLLQWLTKAAGGAAGGAGSKGSAFSFTNPDGSLNMGMLLPLLTSLLGGGLGAYSTNKATGQMTDAIKNANTAVTGLMTPAIAGFQPYQTLGQAATGKLGAYNYKPLAPMFPSAVAPKGK